MSRGRVEFLAADTKDGFRPYIEITTSLGDKIRFICDKTFPTEEITRDAVMATFRILNEVEHKDIEYGKPGNRRKN